MVVTPNVAVGLSSPADVSLLHVQTQTLRVKLSLMAVEAVPPWGRIDRQLGCRS